MCWYYKVSDWRYVLSAVKKRQIKLDNFWVKVYNEFIEKEKEQQNVRIVVDNCIGVLASVSQWFSDMNINILNLCTENMYGDVVITVSFLDDTVDYKTMCTQIKEIRGVKEVVFEKR